MFRIIIIISLLLLPALLLYSHGVAIDYSIKKTVTVRAFYDDGSPVAGGNVVVYSPEDKKVPRLKGIADEQGMYSFTPEDSGGTWDIQVRKDGHGEFVHIELGAASKGTTKLSMLQKGIMAALVLWGLAGTLFFFMKKPGKGG